MASTTERVQWKAGTVQAQALLIEYHAIFPELTQPHFPREIFKSCLIQKILTLAVAQGRQTPAPLSEEWSDFVDDVDLLIDLMTDPVELNIPEVNREVEAH